MVTRRRFLQGAVTAALLGRIEPRAAWAEARASGEDAADANSASTASRYVNVFVGTGGHGHTYPGATVPWGMVQLSPDTNDFDWDACSGYYKVHLTDHDILAELTATARVGLHRYTFNKKGPAHLMVDLAHGYHDEAKVPCKVSDATLKVIGGDTLVGSRRVHQWADGRHIFFAMKVSRPFMRAE